MLTLLQVINFYDYSIVLRYNFTVPLFDYKHVLKRVFTVLVFDDLYSIVTIASCCRVLYETVRQLIQNEMCIRDSVCVRVYASAYVKGTTKFY